MHEKRMMTGIGSKSRAYLEYSACISARDDVTRRGILSWRTKSSSISDPLDDSCLSLQDEACRLCVCCRGCPCEATPIYFTVLFVLVAGGVLVLWLVATFVFAKKSPIPAAAAATTKDDCSSSSAPPPAAPLISLSKEERAIVRRAIDLWDQQGNVLPKDLADQLRETTILDDKSSSTTTRYKYNNKKNGSILSGIFIATAFGIVLLESSNSSETFLHEIVFGPWLWLLGEEVTPSLAKALAMLVLAGLAHYRVGKSIAWEMTRVFFVLSYVGSITYSVVDTGRHEGETSARDGGGSELWYVTTGALGSIVILALSQFLLPDYYQYSHRWIAVMMAMMMFVREESGAAPYRSWIYLLSVAIIILGGAKAAGKESLVKYSQLPNVGTVYLVFAAMMDDDGDDDEFWLHGSWLGLLSISLIAFGATCGCSAFQAGAATVGACVAVIRANDGRRWLGLNAILRLAVIFTTLTMIIGGWQLPPIIALPPKSHSGVSIVLVIATLLLLLATIVVGNSHGGDEWAESMDFGNLEWYQWKGVDGTYKYANRGFDILPWMIPFALYYTVLCRYWPAMEERIRHCHWIRIAALLICACHLLRLVSWSLLFLAMAGISVALPRIENSIRGK